MTISRKDSSADRDRPMPELVSVIIPSYNRRWVLCDCIESVLAQDYRPIEIIVVDDSSQDGTVEHLLSNYRDLVVIGSEHRYGPSHLRNKGLNRADGTYVLFLDSDSILQNSDIISKMTRRLHDDKTIGEIGGEIPVYRGIIDEAHGRKLDYFGNNSVVISRKNDEADTRAKDCDYVATCNCMVRKEVALKAGGFDPYYQFGGEDVDFGRAIRNNGYRNIVDYDVAALHRHVSSGRYEDEEYRYMLTNIMFNLKWHPWSRNAIIFLKDLSEALLFYLLLFPKLIVKIIKGDSIVSANFAGGYYIFKAYARTMLGASLIRGARRTTYLSTDAMDSFETSLKEDS
jgi:GT2 family glycosyltransferase